MGDALSPRKQCTALTKIGTPCRAPVVKGTALCVGHSREGSEAFARHREGVVIGGRLRGLRPEVVPPVPLADDVDLTTPAGLRVALAQALRSALSLPFDASTCHAVAALVRAQLSVVDAAELTERVDRLERWHEATKRQRPRVA